MLRLTVSRSQRVFQKASKRLQNLPIDVGKQTNEILSQAQKVSHFFLSLAGYYYVYHFVSEALHKCKVRSL